jgi:glycosyltransferase involved in cell wall biosynthesis
MSEGTVLQLLGPSTGGIRQVVAALTAGLEGAGWEVRNAGPGGVLDGIAHQEGVVPVGARTALAARRALRELLDGVDVVHAHGLTAGWLAATVRPRPPLVVSVHNVVLDEVAGTAAPLLRQLERLLPVVADRTIALSPAIARHFTGRPGGGKVRVVPPAVALSRPSRSRGRVRDELGVPDGVPLVLTAARLHPQKDLPTFLRAAGVLRDRGVPCRFVVVGGGPSAHELRRLVANLGLADLVLLAGPSRSAIDELAAADVVVVSSLWESGPLAALEALSLGRPLVSTPVGLVPEVVVDGATGRLVPIGDASAMADAIGALLADPVAAERMGAAGRAAVAARMGVGALTSATLAVYGEVLR